MYLSKMIPRERHFLGGFKYPTEDLWKEIKLLDLMNQIIFGIYSLQNVFNLIISCLLDNILRWPWQLMCKKCFHCGNFTHDSFFDTMQGIWNTGVSRADKNESNKLTRSLNRNKFQTCKVKTMPCMKPALLIELKRAEQPLTNDLCYLEWVLNVKS